MATVADKVCDKALSLPADARIDLVERLLSSLNLPTQPEIDRLWAAEAQRRVALVFEKIRTLVSMPQTGERLRTDIPMLKGYWFIQCKNHLVFYREVEGKGVSVLRVLYARRDYLGLLEPDKEGDDDG